MTEAKPYIVIGCTALSFLACLILCLLGIISPIYRKYPSKFNNMNNVGYWFGFPIYSYFFIIEQNNKNELKELHKITKFVIGVTIIIISNQFILFLNEVKICIYNPFQATSSSVFLILLSIQFVLLIGLILIPILFRNKIAEFNQFASFVNYGNFTICTILCIVILLTLRRNKKLQSKTVYEYKKEFVVFQFYWIYAMLILNLLFFTFNLNGEDNDDSYSLKLFISLEGLFFSLFHLLQPYSMLKLKLLFFGKCSPDSERLEIQNVDFGLNFNILDQYMPKYEKLLKVQINELVKGLVKAVHSTLNQQFEHHLDEFEPKRIYTFKFHLSESEESRISYNESEDLISDSIIMVNTYFPNFFTTLLKLNKFTKSILEHTLDLQYNLKAFERAKESMGRSGAFFFHSQNCKLILKTVEKYEIKDFLDGRATQYFEHLNQNQNSLIARIYGLFKIKLMAYKTQYIILMENSTEKIRQLEQPLVIYDLKGSSVNRTSKSTDSVQKDNNFKQSTDCPLRLSEDIEKELVEQLKKDCYFLRDIGYMDYSMLLVICNDNELELTVKQNYRFMISRGGDKIYSISIIDYLQRFNSQKKSEQYFKRFAKFKKKNDLSCLSPIPYCDRFLNFIESILK